MFTKSLVLPPLLSLSRSCFCRDCCGRVSKDVRPFLPRVTESIALVGTPFTTSCRAGGTGAGGGARQGLVIDVHAKPARPKGGVDAGTENFPDVLARACAIVDFRDLAQQVLEAVSRSTKHIYSLSDGDS